MKKSAILVIFTVITISLGLSLIPTVVGQPENVDILSYSWYMHPSGSEALIVVGEAQNNGPNVLESIMVKGTFHTPDGEPYIVSYGTWQITTNILPQQKAPFYIAFTPDDIIGSNKWTTKDATNFTAEVSFANPTDARQYPDLTVTSHTASTDSEGLYRVTGNVQNTGSQSTNQTWVVATFYNSTGNAIAIGFSNYLTPTSLAPGSTATFMIYPHDYTDMVVSGIASYSLTIQTKLTEPSATPTPSPTQTVSPTPTSAGSPTPTPTGTGNGTPLSDLYVYLAVAVVIIVVGLVALVMRKRTGKNAVTPKQTEE